MRATARTRLIAGFSPRMSKNFTFEVRLLSVAQQESWIINRQTLPGAKIAYKTGEQREDANRKEQMEIVLCSSFSFTS